MKNSYSTKEDISTVHILFNLSIMIAALVLSFVICAAIKGTNAADILIPMIFVLAVLLVSLITDGYFYGIVTAIMGTMGIGWAFAYSYMKHDFSSYGYPVSLIIMLAISIAISTLTTRVKKQEKLRHVSEQAQLRANLLRSVSHDLRTPLTSIIGSISTVIDEKGVISDEEELALLGDAKKDAEWLVRMVENLLSITRISGNAEITKSTELLEEIIGDAVLKFRKRNPDTNLTVTVPDEPLLVSVDPMLIEQVLMNLLDNSVHHAEGMTEMALSVSRFKKFAEISVSDNGRGINPYLLDEIFDGQLQSSDSNHFRGIGLAVCKSIVTAHGGTISADNRREGGAVFKFTLPIEEDNDEN